MGFRREAGRPGVPGVRCHPRWCLLSSGRSRPRMSMPDMALSHPAPLSARTVLRDTFATRPAGWRWAHGTAPHSQTRRRIVLRAGRARAGSVAAPHNRCARAPWPRSVGAIDADGGVAELGECPQVAPWAAAEVENCLRRRTRQVAQQGRDVLADVVVARALPEAVGVVVVVRQRGGGDGVGRSGRHRGILPHSLVEQGPHFVHEVGQDVFVRVELATRGNDGHARGAVAVGQRGELRGHGGVTADQ
jgi:hypothetical protein